MNKLRLNRELHERARTQAAIIRESLVDLIGLAVINFRKGRTIHVALDESLLSATRDSVMMTLDKDIRTDDQAEARRALAAAVIHMEAVNPPPFNPGMMEGRDYYIERESE